ncbi:UxaA family hydrolase [Flavonifractor sp. DFI.6.63]|uniref:UxaA family hydrolase n=2 Tax=Lawsonibacter hominis TaxID=2763053 RepID=A0A8J6JBK4_9FIRM|nr:UxaA family hydrolase [Flavonifractor sp. DFI.6.63]MBC5732758.1 UxaA family hydrolase [Lawsonibacter hominis]MCQ5031208.1 UxaA family hydrolase [Flavonifractor sp. DFI.6.63]
MINAVLMASNDDVVTVTQAVPAGGEICYQREGETFSLAAATDVPLYHKAALRDLAEGSSVIKYGEHIGHATRPIGRGEHVHTQNLSSTL